MAGVGTPHRSETDAAMVPASPPDRRVLIMFAENFTSHYRPEAGAVGGYGARAGGAQARKAQALAKEYGLSVVTDWPMPALGVRCFVAELAAGRTPADVLDRLAADPRVESAQALQTFRVLGREADDGASQEGRTIAAVDDWHRGATGKGVIVAQIDSGVDVKHPALRARVSETHNFVDGTSFGPEFHGTAVAGIIVAKTDSEVGGVAPGASLIALRACWPDHPGAASAVCDTFTLAKALQFVLTRDPQVVNLSLGGPRDRLLERLLDKVLERGITVLGAIDPNAAGATFPAHHPGVVAVATTWSPRLPAGTVLLSGVDVLTTIPDARWGLVSGTSFATARVTGLTALLLECSPRLKPPEVAVRLRASLRDAPTASTAAVPDVCAMLGRTSPRAACTCCCPAANPVGGDFSAGRVS